MIYWAIKSVLGCVRSNKVEQAARKAEYVQNHVNYRDAICIHGPIDTPMHVKSIKAMRKIFPYNYIVCATWKGEKLVDDISMYVNEILFSEEPLVSPVHKNHQLVLMRLGLEKIYIEQRKHGVNDGYAMKCRSDQVFFNKTFFIDYRKTVGISDGEEMKYGLSKKLLVYDISKYMLYRVSDFTMCGTTEDMLRYWSQPLSVGNENKAEADSIEMCARGKYAPETFFVQNFCEKEGKVLKYTYEDSWRTCCSIFVIWNRRRFKMIWMKHPEAVIGQTWIYRVINCRLVYKIISVREYYKAIRIQKAHFSSKVQLCTDPTKRLFLLKEGWSQ